MAFNVRENATTYIHANVVYNSSTLAWERMKQPILEAGSVTISGLISVGSLPAITGTVTANIATGGGKTLKFVAIAQTVAGTTTLVVADATKKIKVVNYTLALSALGTTKFIDGIGDLTGAMSIAANGVISANGQASSHLFETAVNSTLSIVTTGGAANGHLSYFLE